MFRERVVGLVLIVTQKKQDAAPGIFTSFSLTQKKN